MAVKATDVDFNLDSNDLSGNVRSATLNVTIGENDASVMGSDWEQMIAGAQSWDVSVEFSQSFANGALDDLLWAMIGSTVTAIVKPTSAAVGTSNPSYTGSVFITQYAPIDASWGENVNPTVTFRGTGTLTRAES